MGCHTTDGRGGGGVRTFRPGSWGCLQYLEPEAGVQPWDHDPGAVGFSHLAPTRRVAPVTVQRLLDFGLALIVAGLVLRFVGVMTTMQTLQHYAFLLVLYGLVLALLTDPAIFRRLPWVPLIMLVFAVPLPSVFNNFAVVAVCNSCLPQLGVWVIRAAGISVLLEGNVIDLGSYQLEVADRLAAACATCFR